MLTTYEGDAQILRALKAGAQGYLLKNTLHSELLQTIRAVHSGRRGLSAEASFQVAQHVSDQGLTAAEIASRERFEDLRHVERGQLCASITPSAAPSSDNTTFFPAVVSVELDQLLFA